MQATCRTSVPLQQAPGLEVPSQTTGIENQCGQPPVCPPRLACATNAAFCIAQVRNATAPESPTNTRAVDTGRTRPLLAAVQKKGASAPFGWRHAPFSGLLGAGLAVVGVVTLGLGLGVGFGQVFAGLGFAVVLGAFAVVGLGCRVDPDLPGATASRCRGGRCRFGGRCCAGLCHRRCWSRRGGHRRHNSRGRRWRCSHGGRSALDGGSSRGRHCGTGLDRGCCGRLRKTRGGAQQARCHSQNAKLRFHGDSFRGWSTQAQTLETLPPQRLGLRWVDPCPSARAAGIAVRPDEQNAWTWPLIVTSRGLPL